MKLAFFGNSIYSCIGAKIIHQTYPLSLVVTIPDRVLGRKKTLTPSSTKDFALKFNIPFLETDKLDSKTIAQITILKPDFLIVEDYGLILPNTLLQSPKYASLNIHHSLLPKYRGPSPVPSTILSGESQSGVSVIEMTESVDAGDILAQEVYSLEGDETTDSLLKTLNAMGA